MMKLGEKIVREYVKHRRGEIHMTCWSENLY